MSQIAPDTKDWTWVLDTPCPECGFVSAGVGVREVAAEIRRNAAAWAVVLHGPAPPSARARTSGRRGSTAPTCATCTGCSASGCA